LSNVLIHLETRDVQFCCTNCAPPNFNWSVPSYDTQSTMFLQCTCKWLKPVCIMWVTLRQCPPLHLLLYNQLFSYIICTSTALWTPFKASEVKYCFIASSLNTFEPKIADFFLILQIELVFCEASLKAWKRIVN
jgi:hypothetical protein